MQAAKITVLSILFFAGLFGVFSVAFYFGDWDRLVFVTSLGVFVGALAAPQFDRKAFKYPTLLQACSGGVAGCLLALFFGLSLESTVALIFIGSAVGASANYWVEYVPVP